MNRNFNSSIRKTVVTLLIIFFYFFVPISEQRQIYEERDGENSSKNDCREQKQKKIMILLEDRKKMKIFNNLLQKKIYVQCHFAITHLKNSSAMHMTIKLQRIFFFISMNFFFFFISFLLTSFRETYYHSCVSAYLFHMVDFLKSICVRSFSHLIFPFSLMLPQLFNKCTTFSVRIKIEKKISSAHTHTHFSRMNSL